MPEPLQKIAFVIEHFGLNLPGQQLLDRFALGYPDNGEFRKLHGCAIAAHVIDNPADAEFQRRARQIQPAASLDECLQAADAVVIVPRELRGKPELLRSVLDRARKGTRCFVYGAVADRLATARELIANAHEREGAIASGTATAVAWRLPDVTLPRGAAFRRALVVVQGEHPLAEIEGLNALFPVLEEAGQSSVEGVQYFSGQDALAALKHGFAPLLASAISRSDTPQGDAVVDGRTQDLHGLGLIPKLAKAPRCWRLRHSAQGDTGFESMLAVLDGVVADYNLAVETASGQIWSWQVYRPPAPFEHVYSRLAAILEAFFRSGEPPWPLQRSLNTSKALEMFQLR